MEEKKLTDEQIIMAYKYCVIDNVDCKNCPCDSWGCGIDRKDIFGLINRQKAEIERLTEENSNLKKLVKSLEDLKETLLQVKAELQRQVDILTAEKENLYFLNKNLEDYIDNHESIWKRNTEQAVKDTAKEIYEIFEKWVWKLKNEKGSLGKFRFAIETVMQEIKEKYSLEVSNFKLVEHKKGKENEKV